MSKAIKITDNVLRDGHQSLFATRMRIEDMLPIAEKLDQIGFSFDWDREVRTSEPDYYHWTQWIFMQLYKKGLAYIAEVPVNWCPELGTVLANEEVPEQVEKGYTVPEAVAEASRCLRCYRVATVAI